MEARRRIPSVLAATVLAACSTLFADSPGFRSCLDLPDSGPRRECATRFGAESGLTAAVVGQLCEAVADHPVEVLAAIDGGAPAGAAAADPRATAAVLDLRGQALAALDRVEEAANAYASAIELDDGTTRLSWHSIDGGLMWSVSLDPGDGRLERAVRALSAAGRAEQAASIRERLAMLGAGNRGSSGAGTGPSVLVADDWRPSLPAMEAPLFGGGAVDLRNPGATVLILDFWASWCLPCREELPRLQVLHEEHGERGLAVVAVNTEEPADVALGFAADLGLTYRIGRYDPAVHRALDVRLLPTLVVADSAGRIHGRWDGYKDGDEKDVEELVLRLLDGDAGTQVELATVRQGGKLFEVAWSREIPQSIEAVAVSGAPGARGLLAAAGRSLVLLESDGSVARSFDADRPVGRLRTTAPGPDGSVSVLSFRPGGSGLATFELPGGETTSWSSPSPVFDAGWLPASPSGGRSIALATLDGLYRASAPEWRPEDVGEFARASAAVVVDRGAGPSLALLETGGVLVTLDASLRPIGRTGVPPDGWSVFADSKPGDAVGVAGPRVAAGAIGRFLGADSPSIAAATRTEELVVVETATGKVRFRARWPGIKALGSGDTDGDGTEELVVVSGRRISVLKPRVQE
jgi:thiol-disulfide isomerase/thioredoxin